MPSGGITAGSWNSVAPVLDELQPRVETFYTDYADALDEDIGRWPELFTADALYQAVSREN